MSVSVERVIDLKTLAVHSRVKVARWVRDASAITSVGAPLAGMNDLNLGIHLHKHTKQPTLLKTSLSCSVNYFVINHNLARSPDATGKYDSMHAGSHNSLF